MRKITTRFMSAFSLMEMMIVLLIISIIAAASAPMVSKKLSRDAGTADNPWTYTDLAGNMAYNMRGGDITALIGARSLPGGFWAENNHPKLYIQSNGSEPQLSFGSNGGASKADLVVDMRDVNLQNKTGARVGISNGTIPYGSVALGTFQNFGDDSRAVVAIGTGTNVNSDSGIAIGTRADSSGDSSIAIGGTTSATNVQITLPFTYKSYQYYGGKINNEQTYDEVQFSDSYNLVDNNIKTIESRIKNKIINNLHNTSNPKLCTMEDHPYSHGTTMYGCRELSKGSGTIYDIVSWGELTWQGIDSGAKADKDGAIAIGAGASAKHNNSVAIGNGATTDADSQFVIGPNVLKVNNINTSSVTANDVKTSSISSSSSQITLGGENTTVYIPGNLVVGKQAALNVTSGTTAIKVHNHSAHFAFSAQRDNGVTIHDVSGGGFCNIKDLYSTYSDRRLKNVGDKFVEGLEALKKIDLYHYTFKNDPDKIEHVGVMAQDLQKVFPNAVITGEDGYLRIRLEDMFYAVINAVKELDTRISEVVNQVKSNLDEITKLKATVAEQQKTIDELKAQNADFEKRLARLEGKKVKVSSPNGEDVRRTDGVKNSKSEKPAKAEKVKKEKVKKEK